MPTATAPSPAKTGIKKLNLGAIAQKSEKSAKAYPVLPENGDVARLVDSIMEHSRQLDALEGSLNVEKAELTSLAKQFYFDTNAGKTAIPSSISAKSASEEILVTFQNRYKGTNDDAAIAALIGADNAARYFKQSFELRVNGDAIPEDAAETLIEEMQELFARHNASAALTAKAIIKPTKEFHTARHTALDQAANLELDRLVPIVAAVKTKTRE